MNEQRGDKHGPRADESLAREVSGLLHAHRETRAEEWRSPEPLADGDPAVSLSPDTSLVGGVPPGITPADVAGRAELGRWLGPGVFPAQKDDLLARLRDVHAPDSLAELLGALPDAEYGSVGDIWRTLSGHAERRP
jgi:hypothetical protein